MRPRIWNFSDIGVQSLLNIRPIQILFSIIRRTGIVSDRPLVPSFLHKFISNRQSVSNFCRSKSQKYVKLDSELTYLANIWGATPSIANRRCLLPLLTPRLEFVSTHVGEYRLYMSMISYTSKYLPREMSQAFDGAGLLKLQFLLISAYNWSEITAWSQAYSIIPCWSVSSSSKAFPICKSTNTVRRWS